MLCSKKSEFKWFYSLTFNNLIDLMSRKIKLLLLLLSSALLPWSPLKYCYECYFIYMILRTCSHFSCWYFPNVNKFGVWGLLYILTCSLKVWVTKWIIQKDIFRVHFLILEFPENYWLFLQKPYLKSWN